jgi:hypothetical protein
LPGSDLFGPRLERIDPLIGQKIVHSSEGNSIYYGLTASLVKGFSDRFEFRTSYTYSKALDDVLDFTGASTPYLPTRRYVDRGLSAYDLRHSFVASGSIESPFKSNSQNNWFESAMANITLSPIITLRSGFPFNLFIGRDVNGDLNATDRPYHAPRNSGQGENFYSVDIRVSKHFYFRTNADGPNLELIVEAINLFNRANFLRVNDIVCGTASQPGFINGCDPKFLYGPFDFKGIRGSSTDGASGVRECGSGSAISIRSKSSLLARVRFPLPRGLLQLVFIIMVNGFICATTTSAQTPEKAKKF